MTEERTPVGEIEDARATVARLQRWRDEQRAALAAGVVRDPATILAMFDDALDDV